MSWVRLDDGFAGHRKVLPLSDAAFRLEVAAICWCNQHANDGHLTAADVRLLCGYLADPGAAKAAVLELVAAGLWDVTETGHRLHDYDKYQPSAQERKASNEAAAERMRKYRERRHSKTVEPAPQEPEQPRYGVTVTPGYAVTSREVLSSRPDPGPIPARPDPGIKNSHTPAPARALSQEQDPQPSAPAYEPASDDNAAAAWMAIERGAGGPEGVGLKRNYGQTQPLWLDDNRAGLWCRNWGELRKARPAPTLADAEKLGRWLAAGGAGDIKTPWQLLAKGGAAPNIGAWLDQTDRWDGISDPRPQRAAPRAPQRLDAVTTSKTKEVRVTNDREGLRRLGIEVSDRVIHGENAGSPSDPGDASGF